MWIILYPFFLAYHLFWFVFAHTTYMLHFYGPRNPWDVPSLLKDPEKDILDAYK